MREYCDISIPQDHPSAEGHFPGNPIVPGALLLDAAVAAIAGERPVTIRAVKFLLPVRPGEAVMLSWEQEDNGAIRFEGKRTDGTNVFMGSLVK
jgi:3-hydroxyacyl-[acyl-carrier-protein] dehydratase